MTESTYLIIFVGNPLLDMQVTNGEKLLEKYNLGVDDGILAEERHLAMYEPFPLLLLLEPEAADFMYFKLR
jgi:adenosine kinase